MHNKPVILFIAGLFMISPISANNTRTIGIIVFDDVLTSEVTAPAEIFRRATKKPWFNNWQVKLIGVKNKKTITTDDGLILGVDTHISVAQTLEVLIVPGAMDMTALLANTELNQFIQAQAKNTEWLSSNCSGAFLLAKSGQLNNRKATTWSGGEAKLKQEFPAVNVVFDQAIVIDNRRLTSNGGLVSYSAALVLLQKLTSSNHAREIYLDMQMDKLFDWQKIKDAL